MQDHSVHLTRSSRFFLRTFRHNLATLFVPVLVLIVLLVTVVGVMLFQGQQTRIQERLQALEETVTSALNGAGAIGSNLAYKRSVIPSLLANDVKMQDELTRQLDAYRASNALYSDVAVWYHQVPYNLYTSQGSIDIEQLAPFFSLDSDVDTYQAILNNLQTPILQAAVYAPASGTSQTGNYFTGDDLLYVTPTMISSSTSRYLTLLTVIDKARLNILALQEMRAWTGSVVMLGVSGRPVFESGGGMPEAFASVNLADLAGRAEVDGYTVFRQDAASGIVYLFLADAHALNLQVLQSVYPVLFLAALAALACFALSAAFSLKAYWPVVRLRRLLLGSGGAGADSRAVETVSRHLLDEQSAIGRQIQTLTATMQVALVQRVLDGAITNQADIERLVSEAKLALNGPLFMALNLRLDRQLDEHGRYELSLTLLQDIGWPYGIVPVVSAEAEDTLMFIASLPAGLGAEQNRDLLLSAVRAALVNYDVDAAIGVSYIKQSISELRDASLEAMSALMRVDDGAGGEADYPDGDEPQALQVRLAAAEACLLDGDLPGAVAALHAWFAALSDTPREGNDDRRIVHMLDTVFEALVRRGDLAPHRATALLSRCVGLHGVEAVEDRLCGIIGALDSEKRPAHTESEARMVERMVDYIDRYVYDPLFSMTMMAEAFDLPVFTFGRLFKQYFGQTFIGYVSQRRIDRAKALLGETDLKLKEIVEMIGYVDVSNFIRKFKMTVGMTPGEYRKAYAEGTPPACAADPQEEPTV